jgi:hypothetical protein
MDTQAATLYLHESLQDLRHHHERLNRHPLKAELRYVRTGSTSAHFQLWWVDVPSPVASAFAWDAFDVTITDTAELDRFVTQTGFSELRVTTGGVSPALHRTIPAGPLFHYQPQRFRSMVPFAKRLVHLASEPVSTMFTLEGLNAVAAEYMTSDRDIGSTILRPKIANPDKRSRDAVIQLGVFFCEFNRTGRQIFDFPPSLVEMFRHTDVDDIPLDALQFPYPCFFSISGLRPTSKPRPGGTRTAPTSA